jgi:hypothetical protein
MKNNAIGRLLFLCLLLRCVGLATARTADEFDDMTVDASRNTETIPGKQYRMGETGICGTLGDDYMTVTYVIPGSPADGKIQVGDIVRGMQHRHMSARGGSLPATARLRLFRVGRDWDWHFYVTVERASLRNGKGNTVVYDLHMPPTPGAICHYGPTGFFAERHTDHLVVRVIEEGSPADGKLMEGDVIVAVDGNPITLDAYHQFTEAVDKAESQEGKGLLRLGVKRTGKLPEGSSAQNMPKNWRPGHKLEDTSEKASAPSESPEQEELDVVLELEVLGTYAETAPVDCSKTDALITETADYLVNSGNTGKLHWGLLGLLATGEETYIRAAAERIRELGKPPKDPQKLLGDAMYVSWHRGYANLLLTEYYLLTGDEYVLPKITQLSRSLASGQDQAGLWGHRMAKADSGRAHGYGVMNQPSLSIFISLILAEKCGVKDPLVRQAIARTHAHYDKWIGQGSLPYGNHSPGADLFTNNGTSGSLAIAFALLGNERGAKFYAAMSAAATEEILLGHSGPQWNILWSGLGANVLGPAMTAAYGEKLRWLRTTTRTWNGRYVEIKGWGTNPSSGSWSTGNQLLNLCTGRRKLHITGKGLPESLWVDADEAKKIVEAGNLDTSDDRSLLTALGSPYPVVQNRAAQALARRDATVSEDVLDLLANGTTRQRIGAIYAIRSLKIEPVVEPLLAIALDEQDDLWVRRLAVGTLANLDEAKSHAPKLLEMLVKEKPYDQPYRELDLSLGQALLKLYEPDPYATDLDRDLFYRGVMSLLNHKHKTGRATGMKLLKNIPIEDLGRVVDKMVYIIEDKDKTYTSYCPDSGRQEALEILYHHGIKESMEYTVDTAKQGRMGEQRGRMRLLKTFGGEAEYLIPRIKEVLGKQADPIVEQIESAPTTREMISLDDIERNVEVLVPGP